MTHNRPTLTLEFDPHAIREVTQVPWSFAGDGPYTVYVVDANGGLTVWTLNANAFEIKAMDHRP